MSRNSLIGPLEIFEAFCVYNKTAWCVCVCNSEKLHINLRVMPIGQFVELKLLTNYICEDVLIRKKIHG